MAFASDHNISSGIVLRLPPPPPLQAAAWLSAGPRPLRQYSRCMCDASRNVVARRVGCAAVSGRLTLCCVGPWMGMVRRSASAGAQPTAGAPPAVQASTCCSYTDSQLLGGRLAASPAVSPAQSLLSQHSAGDAHLYAVLKSSLRAVRIGTDPKTQHATRRCQAQQWPAVSVILPVKGCRAHSFQAWRSQLEMLYGTSAVVQISFKLGALRAVFGDGSQ